MRVVDQFQAAKVVELLHVALGGPQGRRDELLLGRARDEKELRIVAIGMDAGTGKNDQPAAVAHVALEPGELLRMERPAVRQDDHAHLAKRLGTHGRLVDLDHLKRLLKLLGADRCAGGRRGGPRNRQRGLAFGPSGGLSRGAVELSAVRRYRASFSKGSAVGLPLTSKTLICGVTDKTNR